LKKEVESMETGLAILLVLDIFVGIPALIGIAIGGMYLRGDRRVLRDKRTRVIREAKTITHEAPKDIAELVW
jgi:hypothetical protein